MTTRFLCRLLCLLALLVLSLPAAAAEASDLPRILAREDATRYAEIFALQQEGRFAEADRLIEALGDDILMGHVLYQRLMHPRAYRASYRELHFWMKHYGDHPLAERVYSLAEKRRPARGWKPLATPRRRGLVLDVAGLGETGPGATKARRARFTARDREMLDRIRRLVLRNAPTAASKLLATAGQTRLSPAGRAEAWARIARGYLSNGLFEKARAAGEAALGGEGPGRGTGAFYAGIALWATGRRDAAFKAFAAATVAEHHASADLGGGPNLWLARAALATGRYERVLPALERAARNPRGMYGLIALRQLARRSGFVWRPSRLPSALLDEIRRDPALRRALALAEAGQVDRADMELERLSHNANRAGAAAILAIAARIDAPATALRIARMRLNAKGERHDSALYPAPAWRFNAETGVDRALVYAVARRESGFDPLARSHMGATGVMQLMPKTARYVAEMTGEPTPAASALTDPTVSVRLGQAYLAHILEEVSPAGSLIHALAGYNAGLGNVATWSRRLGKSADPLLFLEIIGSAETRRFVRDVMAGFWIYRAREGQETPTLDAIAAGHWPVYIALDENPR